MQTVVSRDGTQIAYERTGTGPPLILIDGAFGSRAMSPNQPLVPLLANRMTVVSYDRRGRGDSGDAPRSSIDREIEDIEALVDAMGGEAALYGISSGAALALEAAARVPGIRGLALYEAPFIVDDSREPIPPDYASHLEDLLADGERASAVRYFMRTGVGVPAAVVALMKFMPFWPKLKAVAHTLPYDTLLVIDFQRGEPLPADRWSHVTQPTLVLHGSKSPKWMCNAMDELARKLPNAELVTLEGQTHRVKAKALAPVLGPFFTDARARSGKGRSSIPAATGLED